MLDVLDASHKKAEDIESGNREVRGRIAALEQLTTTLFKGKEGEASKNTPSKVAYHHSWPSSEEGCEWRARRAWETDENHPDGGRWSSTLLIKLVRLGQDGTSDTALSTINVHTARITMLAPNKWEDPSPDMQVAMADVVLADLQAHTNSLSGQTVDDVEAELVEPAEVHPPVETYAIASPAVDYVELDDEPAAEVEQTAEVPITASFQHRLKLVTSAYGAHDLIHHEGEYDDDGNGVVDEQNVTTLLGFDADGRMYHAVHIDSTREHAEGRMPDFVCMTDDDGEHLYIFSEDGRMIPYKDHDEDPVVVQERLLAVAYGLEDRLGDLMYEGSRDPSLPLQVRVPMLIEAEGVTTTGFPLRLQDGEQSEYIAIFEGSNAGRYIVYLIDEKVIEDDPIAVRALYIPHDRTEPVFESPIRAKRHGETLEQTEARIAKRLNAALGVQPEDTSEFDGAPELDLADYLDTPETDDKDKTVDLGIPEVEQATTDQAAEEQQPTTPTPITREHEFQLVTPADVDAQIRQVFEKHDITSFDINRSGVETVTVREVVDDEATYIEVKIVPLGVKNPELGTRVFRLTTTGFIREDEEDGSRRSYMRVLRNLANSLNGMQPVTA